MILVIILNLIIFILAYAFQVGKLKKHLHLEQHHVELGHAKQTS